MKNKSRVTAGLLAGMMCVSAVGCKSKSSNNSNNNGGTPGRHSPPVKMAQYAYFMNGYNLLRANLDEKTEEEVVREQLNSWAYHKTSNRIFVVGGFDDERYKIETVSLDGSNREEAFTMSSDLNITHLAVDPSGQYLFAVAGKHDGAALYSFKIEPSGKLSQLGEKNLVNGGKTLKSPIFLKVNPSHPMVYVGTSDQTGHKGNDTNVSTFSFGSAGLVEAGTFNIYNGAVRDLSFSASGDQVYLAVGAEPGKEHQKRLIQTSYEAPLGSLGGENGFAKATKASFANDLLFGSFENNFPELSSCLEVGSSLHCVSNTALAYFGTVTVDPTSKVLTSTPDYGTLNPNKKTGGALVNWKGQACALYKGDDDAGYFSCVDPTDHKTFTDSFRLGSHLNPSAVELISIAQP